MAPGIPGLDVEATDVKALILGSPASSSLLLSQICSLAREHFRQPFLPHW